MVEDMLALTAALNAAWGRCRPPTLRNQAQVRLGHGWDRGVRDFYSYISYARHALDTRLRGPR